MQRLFSLLLWSGVLISIVSVASCKHEPFGFGEDPPTPVDTTGTGNPGDPGGHPCSPDSVYFQAQVLPILRSSCALAGCHDDITREEGIVLTSFAKVRATGKVKPGKPNDSDLIEVLKTNGKDRMPPAPRDRLPQEQIDLIAKWIQQGAQDLTCDATSGACNTMNISYATEVFPVISTYCRGCHSGGAPAGNVSLSNYDAIRTIAQSGRLYGAIAHASGFSPMPQGSAKLNQCAIDQIKSWIDAGAPNN